MSAEIVEFKPETDRVIWVCDCGCRTFYANADGYLECATCYTMHIDVAEGWRKVLPDVPEDPPEDASKTSHKVVDLGDEKRQFDRVLLRAKNALAVIAIYADGSVNASARDSYNKSEPAEAEWMARRINDAHMLIDGKIPEDERNG